MKTRRMIGPAAGILLPYLLYEMVRGQSWDVHLSLPRGHFYVVSAVALLSVLIAFAVGLAGRRARNIKISCLSLAFVSLAEVFMVHGLSTPNLMLHATHLPGVAASLSVLLATFWLWMSALPTDHPFIRYFIRFEKQMLPLWTAILAVLGGLALLYPDAISFIPLNSNPLKGIAIALVILINGYTIYRYYHAYEYSRFPLQLSIVYSAGWLIVSQLIMATGETWRLSWWLYHFLLLASMVVMLVGLKSQYAAKKSLAGALRALFTTDPIERITESMSPSVKALMAATESKDVYTAGHNLRVTLYAMQIAQELQLPPDQLRALSQGSIIHDIGKLDIPDEILNKPGRLTEEERSIIEQHPARGYEMCRRLGFMKEELEIIRSHHEKWNGEGYPDRLAGEQIPRLARIVAVADVYDALTSDRAYRQAMSHEQAMAILRENRGTHFDPKCLDAWEQAVEGSSSVSSTTSLAYSSIRRLYSFEHEG